MNLVPLRTAIIAGTCAVALSFVSLPAQAATLVAAPTGGSTIVQATAADTTTDGAPTTTLPAEKGSPKQDFRATVLLPKELATRGLKVRYSGLTPKAHYQPFYGTSEMGGELGKVRKADAKGVIVLTVHAKGDFAWMKTLGAEFTIGLQGIDTTLDLRQLIQVKYDSSVALTTERDGKKVLLKVAVEHETKSGGEVPWKKVHVLLQKKVGTTWTTVKTVRTGAHGHASAKIVSGKAHWRAVVESTTKIAGTTTKSHRR